MRKKYKILSLYLVFTLLFSILLPCSANAISDPMDHPSDSGAIKYSKEFEEIDHEKGIYKIKARIEASDVSASKKDQTVVTIMTSSYLDDTTKPSIVNGIQSYIRAMFQEKDENVEIALITSKGTVLFPMSNYKQESAMLSTVSNVKREDNSPCTPNYPIVFNMFDKNAKKRSIAIWDGDSVPNLQESKIRASQEEIDLYTIFVGNHKGLRPNVVEAASNPSMFFDASEGNINSKYRAIVDNIKTNVKDIGFNGGSLSYKLEEGFDIIADSFKTTNGNARFSRADNLIIWDINELTNEIYGKEYVKYAELEYLVKINKDKVTSNNLTLTDNSAILNFIDNKDQKRTIAFASNEVNFLKTIIKLEKRIVELEAEIERLNKEIVELKRQIKILTWDKERLQRQVDYLENELREKITEIKVLSVKYEQLKTENSDLKYKNRILDDKVNLLLNRVSKLEKELGISNTIIENQNEEIKRLNREIKDKNFEIENLEDQIRKLNNNILDKNADINYLKMEILRKELKIESLEKDIIDKEDKISNLEHQIDLLNIDLENNRNKINELKSQIIDLKSDIKDYKRNIRELEKENQTQKEEIARLKEVEKENEQRKLEIERLRFKIKDLEFDKENLQKQLIDAELRLKEAELKEKEKQDKIDRLTEDLDREKDWRKADNRRNNDNYRAARDEVVYQKRLRDWEGFAMQKERDQDKLVLAYQDAIDKSAINMLINTMINESAEQLNYMPNIVDYTFRIGSTVYTYRDHNGVISSYGMEAAPFISEGRTYIPLRYVANAVGADVNWNQANQTASFSKDGLAAYVKLNNNVINLNNGNVVRMDVSPRIVNNRIFVPVRFISDIFGGNPNNVIWNAGTQSVTIKR